MARVIAAPSSATARGFCPMLVQEQVHLDNSKAYASWRTEMGCRLRKGEAWTIGGPKPAVLRAVARLPGRLANKLSVGEGVALTQIPHWRAHIASPHFPSATQPHVARNTVPWLGCPCTPCLNPDHPSSPSLRRATLVDPPFHLEA